MSCIDSESDLSISGNKALIPLPNSLSTIYHHYLCYFYLYLSTFGFWIIGHNRFTMAWRLTQTYTTWDNSLIDFFLKIFFNFFYNLNTKICPSIQHCQKNSFNHQARIQMFLYQTNGI